MPELNRHPAGTSPPSGLMALDSKLITGSTRTARDAASLASLMEVAKGTTGVRSLTVAG